MFPDLRYPKSEQEIKREQACNNNICRRNVRKKDHTGDNQQHKEGLLCKINLC